MRDRSSAVAIRSRSLATGLKAIVIVAAGTAAVWLAQPLGAQRTADREIQAVETANTISPITVDDVNQSFRLNDSEIIDLQVNTIPGQPQQVAVQIDGTAYTLALSPNTVRSPDYKLVAQIEDGSYVEIDPGPDHSMRGTLIEAPGSRVAGAISETGLQVLIRMPDERRFWIEPMVGRVAGAQPGQHVLYRTEDIIHPDGFCGVDDAFLQQHPPAVIANPIGGTDGVGVSCAEIAADADFEYFTAWGSNVLNVQNRINLVINTMNLQYVNQVDIQHIITQIIVRTTSNDPYTQFGASALLNEFQNHWNANHGNVPRDVAHLFTGRDISGSTIGVAYLGVICNIGSAYGLVQSDCCGSLGCSTDLSAHEIGHNWNAGHCSASCSSTMNAGLTCANTFLNSSPSSVTQIVNFRNAVSCLSACADASLPFFDDFPSTTFDSTKWSTVSGAIIDTVGINEPSAPNSMRLRGNAGTGGNQVRTSRIDTSGLGVLNLDYYYQRTGGANPPEPGDDLIVEYFNNTGIWVEISRQLGSGASMTTYALQSVAFPADAMHSEFRVRFRVSSTQTNLDDWFVDDVGINGIAAPSNDLCENTIVKGAGSHAFSTLGASTDGPAEPALCNTDGDTQVHNDIWYKYLAQCTGTATISLCGANYDAKIAIYPNACFETGGSAIACNDNFCGSSPEVTFPTTQGTVYRVRVGGAAGTSGSGTMVISCTPTPPPLCDGDTNNDGIVNATDLLAVINAWGACSDCPEDLNDDGLVNASDLLAVINAWGPCP